LSLAKIPAVGGRPADFSQLQNILVQVAFLLTIHPFALVQISTGMRSPGETGISNSFLFGPLLFYFSMSRTRMTVPARLHFCRKCIQSTSSPQPASECVRIELSTGSNSSFLNPDNQGEGYGQGEHRKKNLRNNTPPTTKATNGYEENDAEKERKSHARESEKSQPAKHPRYLGR
jgi:hypothetical protein